MRLFIDRAVTALPTFTLTDENAPAVMQVCQRLGGIPLAIELAAARVRTLIPEQIAARLDDRFRLLVGGSRTALPRHQTLQALIDWSYDLLSHEERTTLRRLSVFAGGWTLEAAEAVGAGKDVEACDVLDLLSRLVDKSLVIAETRVISDSRPSTPAMRYRLLETVRQYARDRLLEDGEGAQARRRHYEFFLRLAEEAEPELRGPEQGRWLDRLEEEHDNLRAALDGCDGENGGAVTGVRLAGALWWFWVNRGYSGEGEQRIKGVLSRGSGVSPAWRAKALQGAWNLASGQGDHASAQMFGEEGLSLAREAGDPWLIAYSLFQLGIAAADHGLGERAAALATESLAFAREVGDPWLISHPLLVLGAVARYQGDYERATGFFTESLALARQAGDQFTIAMRLMNLGLTAQAQRNFEQARTLCREGLALCHELKYRRGVAWCLEAMAGVAGEQGRVEQAAHWLGAVAGLLESISLGLSIMPRAYHERNVSAARAGLGDEAFGAAWAAGRAMPPERVIAEALTAGETG